MKGDNVKKIVIGNLKTTMNFEETNNYLEIINKEFFDSRVIICPTSIYISYFLGNGYQVGLQNTFLEEGGPYTGEVLPSQAISMGIKYTIIGHSERRKHLNEKDKLINKKVIAAIKHNLKVVLCVGETLEEREMLKTDLVLRSQLINALDGLTSEMLDNVIIAYEPVWAIGTNKVASNNDIEQTANYLKMIIKQKYDYDDIRVIYGGSVNHNNIKTLNQIKSISGFLVGGASTNPKKFLTIINEVIAKQ